MSSGLAGIALEKRRRFAAALALLAIMFVAVGLVAATGDAPTRIVRLFAVIALIVAVLLGAMALGVTHSVKIDRAEARLDGAIEAAVAAHGVGCGCGHEHDVDEMHVKDNACPVSATACTHSCDTCVLAAMKPSATQARAERLAP